MNASAAWSPFLPRHALVMRKLPKRSASSLPESIPLTAMAAHPPGQTTPRVLFVGEGPLEDPARELLDRMILAMGLEREGEPGDFIFHESAPPQMIVALGASSVLVPASGDLASARGKFGDYRGIPVMPTWHPSHLLNTPAAKKEAWQDLQAVARRLGLMQ